MNEGLISRIKNKNTGNYIFGTMEFCTKGKYDISLLLELSYTKLFRTPPRLNGDEFSR